MAEFSNSIRNSDEISVVDIKGYLDAHTAPNLEKTLTELIDNKRYNIVINFKSLDYISSAGLGVFMAFIEQVREQKGDIKFANMSPKIYNIFDLLGFPMLYEFYNTEEEAFNKFRQVK